MDPYRKRVLIEACFFAAVSHFDYFRGERSKRADMKAMDTNKLILRLERLMTSLPVDPVKRRAHEQSIVTWLPEEDVKLCPNCAKSFNITRFNLSFSIPLFTL